MQKAVRYPRVKILFWSMIFLLGLVSIYATYLLFLPFLLGFLFALFLQPGVDRFEKRGLSRLQSIFLVFSFSGICFLLLLMYLLPMVFLEIQELNENKDYYVKAASTKYDGFKKSIEKRYPKSIPWKDLENAVQHPSFLSKNRLLDLPAVLGTGLEFLFGLLFLPPLFAFFFLKDGPKLKKTVLATCSKSIF